MAFTDYTTDRQPFAVGDRIVTGTRLTMPEGLEDLAEMLIDQPGEVVETTLHQIQVTGLDGAPEKSIPLSVASVRLDALPEHTLIFHVDELHAEYTGA